MKRSFAFPVIAFFIMSLLLTSCEKKEQAIVLPPPGDALRGTVAMGEGYENQVFYDLENNTVVGTSPISSWDLAFEADAAGSHVFMNGGKGIFLYNTHKLEFSAVRDLPGGFANSLLFDDSSGQPDSTAVREWRDANGQSKREIFIAKLNDQTYYKFSMISVDATHYQLEYGLLADATPKTATIEKNSSYTFSYFSFSKGVVMPDPPKANWDIVFTRYRFIYRDLKNFPYEVNGVLLNPCQVTGAADSSQTFEAITYEKSLQLTQTNHRDVVGSDWKQYNFTTSHYDVNKNKCYVLHTRNGKVFKLHFLDFYDATGIKGSPSFEIKQMQ